MATFLETLQELGGAEEYETRLREVVRAVKDNDKSGKLVITLNVSLGDDGVILIADDIKTAKPRAQNSSVFILGQGGELVAQQLSMPLDEVN